MTKKTSQPNMATQLENQFKEMIDSNKKLMIQLEKDIKSSPSLEIAYENLRSYKFRESEIKQYQSDLDTLKKINKG